MSGPQCCVPAPSSSSSSCLAQECIGKEEMFCHLPSYVVSPPSPSKSAVILITDIFGYKAPLLRKLADKIATAGFFVVAPDVLENDPFDPKAAPIFEWIKKHSPVATAEEVKKIVRELKSQGYTSIGATGFCWGAKVVVEVAKEEDLQAVVLCHPSSVSVEDIKALKVNIAILGAENDQITPPHVVTEFAGVLESKKEECASFVKIYPGVAHGWAIRYDAENEKECNEAEEAHHKLLDWFKTHLL